MPSFAHTKNIGMDEVLKIRDIEIEVYKKDIKNFHLSVLPPNGKVRISVPVKTSRNAIIAYATSNILWIRKEREKLALQARETRREYIDRESHYLWGRRHLLAVVKSDMEDFIEVSQNKIFLHTSPNAGRDHKEQVLYEYYRKELKKEALPIVQKFTQLVGVVVKKVHIQRMKTQWGSCNPEASSIRLNSELAKKPPEFTEYVIAHEITHLLDHTHGDLFVSTMDRIMPMWKERRNELNRLPLGYEKWDVSKEARL